MKAILTLLACGVVFWLAPGALGRTYVPMGESLAEAGGNRNGFLAVKKESRPALPGLRPVSVELLEDGLRRKRPIKIGSSISKAHDSVLRNWLRAPAKRAYMKAILAEAMYLERNPQWGYVKSPIASQHDLYAHLARRRTPFTAQVKTHTNAKPDVYGREMVKDYKSNLFLVPDDHVAGLKDYWRKKIEGFRSSGQIAEAESAQRQLARVRGLGFSSTDLDAEFDKAGRYILRSRQANYISLGAALAMTVGPDLWDLATQGSLDSGAGNRWIRSGVVIATSGGTAFSLKYIAKGSWIGTWKGNALVATSLILADGWFSAQDRGGFRNACTDATYYCRMAGSVSGTSLAFAVGAPVAVWVTSATVATGPWSIVFGGGAGLLSGGAAYVVGSWAGESGTRWVLEHVNPELLHKAELKLVQEAQESLRDRIATSQNLEELNSAR